jgi:nodulation protein E
MGCVSGLGVGVSSTWDALLGGETAARPVEICGENLPSLVFRGVAAPASPAVDAALVAKFGRRQSFSVDRFAALASLATAEALEDAGLSVGDPQLSSAAIIYGSASGGNASIEAGYQRLFDDRNPSIHPLTIPKYMSSAAASHLSVVFRVRGPCHAISSACASSAHAIEEGMHFIRNGRAEIVVVGGSDASLTYGSMQGWRALNAISDDACRPFSQGRTGTVIGEGAATLVLEAESSARARGAPIYAEVVGAGSSSDARHLTQPDAEGAAAAIRAAYRDAEIAGDAPCVISAHGTGTLLNDRSEAVAMRTFFGANLSKSKVMATKSSHGHLLGAAGALEFLIAILALRARKVPPVLGFLGADPECDLPLALELAKFDAEFALSTSFAFGGLNCALLARLA